MSKAII